MSITIAVMNWREMQFRNIEENDDAAWTHVQTIRPGQPAFSVFCKINYEMNFLLISFR